MLEGIKKFVEAMVLPQFDLKGLSKEVLEVIAFVLIGRLREVAKLTPNTFDDELVEKLAEMADKIDPSKDRA